MFAQPVPPLVHCCHWNDVLVGAGVHEPPVAVTATPTFWDAEMVGTALFVKVPAIEVTPALVPVRADPSVPVSV
jgi:hypothetical protein